MKCAVELTQESLQEYIAKKEFMIYLQPQYSVSENTVVGAEALARWVHEGSFISPGEFIPRLEQNGLVTKLDRYLWECVFSFQAKRQQQGLTLVPISINVSREDFSNVDVYKTMMELSKQYEVDPEYIHIEITESAFVSDGTTIFEAINKLKSSGYMILIDDFGSGYSALNILKDIAADVIKLDMKFFDLTKENSAKGVNIIESVIQMAKRLGLGLIAEGVENTEQLDILKECGCDIIQGYFFYRPMNVDDFNKLLNGINSNTSNKTMDLNSFGKACYQESLKLTIEGKYDDALTLAKRAATQIDLESDAELYCQLQNLTGIIYGGLGNEMMALDHYLLGLSAANSNNVSLISAKICNNIGSEYQKLGAFKQSIKYFELSLMEQEKIVEDDIALLAYKTNLNLCMCYIELKEYDKASKCLDCAYTYIENPEVNNLRFHYQTIQDELLMKTGHEKQVRESFPALVEAILGFEDSFNIWDNFERLGRLALELKDYTNLKRIIDSMQKEFEQIPEEMIDMDVLVAIQEFRLAYYEEVNDQKELRKQERAYVDLCKKMCQQTWKDRATTIDYKIQIKTEYEENLKQRKQIDIDQLTKVGNRYKLEKDYKLLQKSSNGNNIGIGIIDLDYFKEVNDTYGHLQGDNYLKTVSEVVKDVVKDVGSIYRYVGDEFVVLLSDVDTSTVEKLASRICENIKKCKLQNEASEKKIQTASQGYVVSANFKDVDIWQFLSYANRQLYAAKQDGKDAYKIMSE